MKLYVLVRSDLEWQHRAVQAGHAVAEFLLRYPNTEWDNGVLIYLRVDDEFALDDWAILFDQYVDLDYAIFFEEDRGGEMTAIAAVGIDHLVKDLPLL